MYEQILRRKSIRNYKEGGIPQEAAQALVSWRDWVHPLKDRLSIDNHIRRLPGDAHLKGMFLVNAPEYLLYTSQQSPLARVNAGFILEQISLCLSMFGVGTCFIGNAQVDPEHLRSLRFDPMILMAYGLPEEPLTRNVTEFKRKRIEQIASGDISPEMRKLLEYARLAPSAMNRQPWRFVVQGNDIHCYAVRGGIGQLKQLSEIDVGIALSHIYLAVTEQGGNITFGHKMPGEDLAPRGTAYLTTATIL